MRTMLSRYSRGQSLVETILVITCLIACLLAAMRLCRTELARCYRRTSVLISLPIP